MDWNYGNRCVQLLLTLPEAVRHERVISNTGRKKLAFAERDECKPVLLELSLAGNLVKPLLSLYGTKWSELGYRLCFVSQLEYS
jgi:hypothetical protein